MAAGMDSPSNCELPSVIRFLQAEVNSAGEIRQRMSQVNGENFMADGVIREWRRIFKEGRVDVHDRGGQGCKELTKWSETNEGLP
ncbi:hypothetical protein Trydic_g4442 [Trypoxylus dichotomus]